MNILQKDPEKYIEKNSEYYKKKWNAHKNPFLFAGWNWAAFFFAPFWAASRHMYGAALFYWLFYLGFALLESFLPALIDAGAGAVPSLWLLLFPVLLIHSFFGLFGNALYARKVSGLTANETTQHLPPIFNKSGWSPAAGSLVPLLFISVLAWPLLTISQWSYNPALEEGVYVYGDDGVSPQGQLDVSRNPLFEKYESRINMFYVGEALDNRALSYELLYEENDQWVPVRDQSVAFFSTDKVSLEILDAEDPAVQTGNYRLEVYVEDMHFDAVSFEIIEPSF
ncbi:DUF2628 domain-containing protein [Alkalicoccus saliphilus]|uniref:DUF2628 domain-containing protein n=1 Tax=Alkalicoccus saliphilus TaxID=200989 RepID=A0A2T4U5F5_9BACI|nr:DUF2628 domain-containing protein [Alkalicoccus saliphilus]PTL38595.1 hypothetical protein C6Y45_10435 [Alkalicoccus saliphilus]